MALLGALFAHALLSRVVKALLWAWAPLATDGTQTLTYQRRVYSTADPRLWPVVCVAAGAGLAWGVGLVWPSPASPWLMLVGALGVLAALAVDLQRWERVAVSVDSVWIQRGLGQAVQRVLISSICDVQVHEFGEVGFTLRHGFRNRSARVSLLLSNRYLILPKTDAWTGGEAVEKMVDFLVLRLQKMQPAEQSLAPIAPSTALPGRQLDEGSGSSAPTHSPSLTMVLAKPTYAPQPDYGAPHQALQGLQKQPKPVTGAPIGPPPSTFCFPPRSIVAVQPLAHDESVKAAKAVEITQAVKAVEGLIQPENSTPPASADAPTWWPVLGHTVTDPLPHDEALRQALQRLRDQAKLGTVKPPGSPERSS